jgi:hypothetical protein
VDEEAQNLFQQNNAVEGACVPGRWIRWINQYTKEYKNISEEFFSVNMKYISFFSTPQLFASISEIK